MIFRKSLFILAAAALLLPQGFSVEGKTPPRQKGKTAVSASADTAKAKQPVRRKVSAYKRFAKDVADSTSGGDGLRLYRTTKGKVYMCYPKEWLGREMMVGGTVSSVGDPSLNIGMKYSYPSIFRVLLQDSLVVLEKPNYVAVSSDPAMRAAYDRNFLPTVFKRLPVVARQGDAVVFEVTSLVIAAAPKGKEFKTGLTSEDKTSWFGPLKSFGNNASVLLFQNTEFSASAGSKVNGSMSSTVSFLMLPEVSMRPRLADPRVGVFATTGPGGGNRFDLTASNEGLRQFRIANRWRVEPADTVAWLAGKTVEVVNPIVWYVDDCFPELWKDPIRKGILAWNEAFEAFGLKDVMQVRAFPSAEEDPAFDPDNLAYNCIRFIPSARMNAMGPSWVNPLTGEILNASVLVFYDVVNLLNQWRFVQTAQVDERVRCGVQPDDLLQESLVYVISHEIGHTLGLMHNMAASSAFDVESLRDPDFTAKYGTTPSIMDYARFNYVAQPSDKGVRLIPPSLGVYDKYAIEWLYRPVPQARDMWEEAAIAGALVDAHAGDALYRFSAQQSSTAAATEYDPTARKDDLGNDPVKAGKYGVSNLRYILSNMDGWVTDDDDYSRRAAIYNQLCTQYLKYLRNAAAQIGGVKICIVKEGTPCHVKQPVPKAAQKAALKWVIGELGVCSWLNEPSVTSHLPFGAPASNRTVSAMAARFANSIPSQICLCATLPGDVYGLKEYFDDLYEAAFGASVRGAALSSEQKTLQREILSAMTRPVNALQSSKTAFADDEEADICFGEGMSPYQKMVDAKDVDETLGYKIQFVRRVKTLAKAKSVSGPVADRAHYEYLNSVVNL